MDEHVLAEDSLELGRQRLERAPGLDVPRVGLELDAHAAAALERVLEQQQLRLRVGAAVPGLAREPCVADLDATVLRSEVQEARAAEKRHLAAEELARDRAQKLNAIQQLTPSLLETCKCRKRLRRHS